MIKLIYSKKLNPQNKAKSWGFFYAYFMLDCEEFYDNYMLYSIHLYSCIAKMY